MSLKNKVLALILLSASFIALVLVSVGAATYAYYLPTIVKKQALINHNDVGLTLLDSKGKEFFSFYDAKQKEYVPLSQISDYVKRGVIAAEDDEFYGHHGFSYKGIARSAIQNFFKGSISSGGSTITQQLVKNTLLSPDRNYIRKFKEVILATEIEQFYSKDQILEMYLNTSYFGDNAFGIQNAAQKYFGIDAKDLNLEQSAYLIGLLPSPTRLSEDLALAKVRQRIVLNRMVSEKTITEEQAQSAAEKNLAFVTSSEEDNINTIAPHFALFVRDYLIDKFGERKIVRSGYRVKTTLVSSLQVKAEEEVAKQINNIEYQGAHNGAAVVMNTKGEILAMVGSRDWNNDLFGKVNMATTPRQPGSSFKPIVYALALENHSITPATVLEDKRTTFRMTDCYTDCEYKPQNYDKKYRGRVTVRRALANSLNVPAVEVMQKVGIDSVLTKAPQVGINSLGTDTSKYGLSLVLGTGEVSLLSMTNSYAAFANGGKRPKPVFVTQIIDKSGNMQDVSDQNPSLVAAWGEDVAFLISSILSDNSARREVFGNALTISRPAAVKTGTSENYKDAWTIGYTPDVIIGVWVGNNDMRPMNNIAGALGAAPIWRGLMEYYHQGLAVKNFEPPSGVVRVAACTSRDQDATESARITQEYFLSGTEPSRDCFSIPRNIAAFMTPIPKPTEGITGEPTPMPTSVEENQDFDKIEREMEREAEKIRQQARKMTEDNKN